MSSDDEVEITGVRENPRKSAEYHRQRAEAAIVVKREARKDAEEARADEAEAEKDVERLYIMQDGERHQFDFLVRLVQQSIDEQRVITQNELKYVTNMRWQDAAAANTHTQAAATVAAAAPRRPPAPAGAASIEAAAPAAPASLPVRSIKPLRKAIQKLVDANQAAIDPPSSELLPTALQAGMLVWGYYKSDRVWYPGTVRETGGHLSVLFDDGDVDDELYDAYDPRPWRLRVDQGSSGLSSSGSIVGSSSSSSGISSSIGSSGQADPEPKRRRLAKESVPAVAPAVAPSLALSGAPTMAPSSSPARAAPEEIAMPARAVATESAPPGDAACAVAQAAAAASAVSTAPPPVTAPTSEPNTAAPPALAVVPKQLTAGVWQVKLGGNFVQYEEPHVERALEAAFLVDTKHFAVPITVRGKQYHVHRKGALFEQVLDADKTKVRDVRRMEPAATAAPAAATVGPTTATAAARAAPPAVSGASAAIGASAVSSSSTWWRDPRRFEASHEHPEHIPNAEVLPIFVRLTEEDRCDPLLCYLVWENCRRDKGGATDINSAFVKLCNKFDVFEIGFDSLCGLHRDETVIRNGQPVTYKAGGGGPGTGIDPSRAGRRKLFTRAVKACVSSGGNGGVIANTIQDFLENARDHPLNPLSVADLGFVLAMEPEQQKSVLQDLMLIQAPESKTVKHGVEFAAHLKASGGDVVDACTRYLRERLEQNASQLGIGDQKHTDVLKYLELVSGGTS